MSEDTTGYDASHIQVLEAWEAVRKRPGMYIGSTGERGLSQLVFEVADRAVNEALTRGSGSVGITLMADGGVRVADDGAGVAPAGPDGGGPGLEALLTRIGPGGEPGSRHDVTLGFCRFGPGVVNALSSRMTAEVRRDGVRRVQEYARGVAVTPVTEAGAATGSGTSITFWPDADVFTTAEFSFDALAERFRELAFLNRGLEVSLTDRRGPGESRSVRFGSPEGVRDLVVFLDGHMTEEALTEIVAFEHEDPRMAGVMEVAFRWCGCRGERIRGFANSRRTVEGTHTSGFRDGVAAAVTAYARERRLLSAADPDVGGDRIGEGLTAVVSVKLDRPEFGGATRGVLDNPGVRDRVGQAVQEHLGRWLREHPVRASAVTDRIVRGVPRH
ncbi:DNA gyrase subunit B [Streptomyces sp. NPDC127038]|uniref:DNA gyrase subunit B n=1 Tax=Streptomyces sp. NPDC127038 TaxID=3347114 RepID=UPI003659F12F